MNHIEGSFKGVRNANIYYQAWLPEGDVKAVLLIVHGLGEHCGRYMNVVNHFVPLGYAVYGLDHIGHGKSEGTREFVQSFEDFTNTLTIYFNMVTEWQTGKPVFLVGHSMGGLIASHYLLDYQANFKGAVISAPAVKVSDSISQTTIVMGKILSALAPKMGLLGLDANALCDYNSETTPCQNLVSRAKEEESCLNHGMANQAGIYQIRKCFLRPNVANIQPSINGVF